jgi:adenosylcobinamide-phosphate synthase
MYPFIALGAYGIDMFFGEFRFIRHPVIWMGDFIKWFEKLFYADNKVRGVWLTLSLLCVAGIPAWFIAEMIHPVVLAIFSSMFLAHRMLYESVQDAIGSREKLSMLVSRDTENLTESEMNKALVETYAENLSDGVIAPLLYLLFFGFTGVVLYKAVNTLDSMVGYKTPRYENFGWFSARLDDWANLIPARLTAVMIMLLYRNFDFRKLHIFARGHKSPNAGYPISAAALCNGLKLGGSTPYHGQLVEKPWFGDGKEEITKEDLFSVLRLRKKVDFSIVSLLSVLLIVTIFLQ